MNCAIYQQAILQNPAFTQLDIDNGPVENAIVKSILDDSSVQALIDEFVYEAHVDFKPMLPSWGGTIDPAKTLADSYDLFYHLRMRGIRAHSWV